MARTHLFMALALAGAVGCGASSASKGPAADNDGRPAGPETIAIPASLAVSSAPADVENGKAIFTKKGCPACHKVGGGKLVGPDLKGVMARRNPKWVARMILHPEIMIQLDPTARELLKTHFTPMANQNVNPDSELPAIMSYLKANEQ